MFVPVDEKMRRNGTPERSHSPVPVSPKLSNEVSPYSLLLIIFSLDSRNLGGFTHLIHLKEVEADEGSLVWKVLVVDSGLVSAPSYQSMRLENVRRREYPLLSEPLTFSCLRQQKLGAPETHTRDDKAGTVQNNWASFKRSHTAPTPTLIHQT